MTLTPEEIAKLPEAERAAAQAEADKAKADSQDPTKLELEKREAQKRTEKEKAEFSLKKNAQRLKDLGGDPTEILGGSGSSHDGEDDGIPQWYKDEQAKKESNTALQMADKIPDEDTKKLVKEYLSTNIKPSGNAETDFKLALAAASALKNKQVIEEINRHSTARTTASGGTVAAHNEDEFVPTPEEQVMMSKPYNLSKAKIIEARRLTAEKE